MSLATQLDAALNLTEAIRPRDKKVVDAFLDKKEADGKVLSSEKRGSTLELRIMGMGGTVAKWNGDKIDLVDTGSRLGDSVKRVLRKKAPRNWLNEALTPVQRGRAREKAIKEGFIKLFKQHGIDLEQHRLRIDSRGDIFIASKGTEAQSRGAAAPPKWPKALVSKLAKAGLEPRPGTVAMKLKPDSQLHFARVNHFNAEKVLSALGLMPTIESFEGLYEGTRSLSDSEAKSMRRQVKTGRSVGRGGKKYPVGSKVKWDGATWIIGDLQADSGSTDGVQLVLVSPDYKKLASGVDPKSLDESALLGESSETLIDLHVPPLIEVSEGGFKYNACSTPLKKAREYAEEVFQKAGKNLDEVIPDFDKNYADLQKRCKKALNIPRVQMPVIEPRDMDEFNAALNKGRLDIFKPWVKGKLHVPKNLKGGPEGTEWVMLGLKDGNKRDDVVRAKMTTVSASRLLPTQSQIWLDKLAALIAQYGAPKAGSPIAKATIIVSKEGYILDGHHRFGQAILANPSLKMKALVIPMPINLLLKVGRTYGNAVGNQQKA